MNELARPFVQVWDWVSTKGGMPGQMLFVIVVIVAVLGATVWLGNRGVR